MMPDFHSAAMQGSLPPTPPYRSSFEAYMGNMQHFHHGSSYMLKPPRLDSAVDYSHAYPPPLAAASHGLYSHDFYSGAPQLPPIHNHYDAAEAPILPPLRINETGSSHSYYQDWQIDRHPDQSHKSTQEKKDHKEEQVTGGVSATLDYEMDRMTNFVAEKAQSMYALFLSDICLADIDIHRSIQSSNTVHTSFRKWVSQVLAATRLPSATILLSLHYLTFRMQNFPKTISGTDSQLYRLLAVSMILGSKFLDDNTFINRSWSDVTGIKVTELNALEREWLALIQYDLHIDPYKVDGVSQWIRIWKEYDLELTNKARFAKLLTIDTSSPQSAHRRDSSQQGYTRTAHGSFTPNSTGSFSSASSTPYTSADPWNRPAVTRNDFYQYPQNHFTNQYNSHDRYLNHTASQRQVSQYQLPPLQSLAPMSSQPWNQNVWDTRHHYGCHCLNCPRQYPSYMLGSRFGLQTVVG